jgi:hypothetical protein
MTQKNRGPRLLGWIVVAVTIGCFCAQLRAQSEHRIIEILADRDSRYKIAGQKQPVITAKPGEELTLRITARKAQTQNRDGSIHGLTLLRAKDHKPVDGWDLLLKPGTHDFDVAAPADPGEYVIVCTVICSPDHEQMSMRFVVAP